MNIPLPPPDPNNIPAGYTPYAGSRSLTREHPDGATVLTLGILGILCCGFLAPFAWAKAARARNEMEAEPGVTWSNSGSVTAGLVLGVVGTGVLILGVVARVALMTGR